MDRFSKPMSWERREPPPEPDYLDEYKKRRDWLDAEDKPDNGDGRERRDRPEQ